MREPVIAPQSEPRLARVAPTVRVQAYAAPAPPDGFWMKVRRVLFGVAESQHTGI